jgi:hypothetical protein
MKRTLFVVMITLISLTAFSQLKGTIPLDRNLRPVQAYKSGDTVITQLRTEFPDSLYSYTADSVRLMASLVMNNFDVDSVMFDTSTVYVCVIADESLGTDTLFVSTNANPQNMGARLFKNDSFMFPVTKLSKIYIYSHTTGYIVRFYWER